MQTNILGIWISGAGGTQQLCHSPLDKYLSRGLWLCTAAARWRIEDLRRWFMRMQLTPTARPTSDAKVVPPRKHMCYKLT